jgi:hypothetical protein
MLRPVADSQPDATTPGHALVGVIHPPTQVVLARPLAQPGNAPRLVDGAAADLAANLQPRHIQDGRRADHHRLAYPQADIPEAKQPAAAGEAVVDGVGVAAGTSADQPENFCLTEIGELGTDWLCLIDPLADTVTVHTGDGHPSRVYPLAG